jgi:hypothetical protein
VKLLTEAWRARRSVVSDTEELLVKNDDPSVYKKALPSGTVPKGGLFSLSAEGLLYLAAFT